MDVNEWQDRMVHDIADFAELWLINVFNGHPNYPAEMEQGEWDEQFAAFVELNKENKNA